MEFLSHRVYEYSTLLVSVPQENPWGEGGGTLLISKAKFIRPVAVRKNTTVAES